MTVIRRKVDTTIEQKILVGMVVSTKFLKGIQPMFSVEYLQNSYVKKVSRWIWSYFEKYKEAPGKTIEDIYAVEKDSLSDSEAELVSTLLTKLSKEYEQEAAFNSDYLLDQAVKYFTSRSLTVVSEKISAYTKVGDLENAQSALQSYRKVAKSVSTWVNPFDKDCIREVYDAKVVGDETDQLFKFPGVLGSYFGGFERSWLVSLQGPEKRGKTWWLQEFGFQALFNRLKVAIFTLEMPKTGFLHRGYKRITALSHPRYGKDEVVYPCFDCAKNQDSSCTRMDRENRIRLLSADGERPSSIESTPSGYSVCTKCRGTRDFATSTWYEYIKRDKMTFRNLSRQLRGIQTMYGDRLRVKIYPTFSANLATIMNDLDTLEYTEDFIPDVVIIDYADILAPEDRRTEGRDRIDETWKSMKRLASERHILVVTATQAGRSTFEKRSVRATDTSEDIRKLAHVDAMLSLNQLPVEKDQGIMRLGIIVHRWKEFNELRSIVVLQQLDMGQTLLDSECET